MAYTIFISEDKLKSSTAIQQNVDVDFLLPFVVEAQKLFIETRLGTDLTQKLKDEIIAGTLAGAYKTLVDTYIGDSLPGFSFYQAFPYLRFKVENGNIYSKTSETGNALSTEEAQHMREEIMNTAEFYVQRLIDYITNNTSSFPEYSTSSGADISPDKDAYYSGMNLERNRQKRGLTLDDFLTPDLS